MKIKYKNYYYILVLCLTSLFNLSLNAQWESFEDNIIPLDHRVWSIKIAPDNSVWAIATFDNFPPINHTPKIIRSIDNGDSWSSSEVFDAISSYGLDISPLDSLNAFVALDTSGLYKTQDGGETWSKVSSYIFEAYYIHFFNENEGWVAGSDPEDNGRLVMSLTSDGGQTWLNTGNGIGQPEGTSLPSNTDDAFAFTYSIKSSYDVYENTIILGRSRGNYWRSDDKGYHWTNHETPLAELNILTSNVAIKDQNTFMVAGDILFPNFLGTNAMNFTTTDGGDSWEISGSSGMTAAASHYIPNSDSIFIMVGHNNFGWGEEGTAISYNLGKSWEKIDDTGIIALDFLNENTAYGSCCNNIWETANGQIHKWDFDLPTSSKTEKEPAKIYIWPNPVKSHLTISLNNEFQSDAYEIEIIALDGKIMFDETVQSTGQLTISTAKYPTGFYLIRIRDHEKSYSKKFIKQ